MDKNIDPASLIALQDVTGIYGPKSNPAKPTQPTKLVQLIKTAKPSKPTEPAKKHTNKPATPKKGKGYDYNSSVHGETIKGRNKANGTTNNVMPHAENTARPKGVLLMVKLYQIATPITPRVKSSTLKVEQLVTLIRMVTCTCYKPVKRVPPP